VIAPHNVWPTSVTDPNPASSKRRALRTVAGRSAVSILVILGAILFSPIVRWTAGQLAVDWYEGDGDVLVVLGGGMLVGGTGPNAALNYDSYLRGVYAGWMLKRFRFPMVVVAGSGGLAEALSTVLRSQGASGGSILLERRSHTTEENAIYVRQLLEQHSVPLKSSRIVIVTSDFHCFRARRTFAKRGITVRVMPVPDVGKRCGSVSYRLEGFVTITQELGKTAFYWFSGRM
jgi:uncharacterized SAM-binding protein YcdF (DUF218 family)